MKKKTCGNCGFGEPVGDRIKCRRFPPTCDGKGSSSSDTQPIMHKDDWCGEHNGQKQT